MEQPSLKSTELEISIRDAAAGNFLTPKNDLFYSSKIYRPLQAQKKEIRLLRLLPGQLEDPLSSDIIDQISLTDLDVEYQALSYCAGDVNDNELIKVQGLEFNVFASVGAALRRLRDPVSSSVLWIDQICIDQSNITEREQQVLLMRSIYASATQTVVWLGEDLENHTEEIAVSFLQLIHQMLALLKKLESENSAAFEAFPNCPRESGRHDYESTLMQSVPKQTSRENGYIKVGRWLMAEILEGKYSRGLAAVATMAQMPWWQRCWIVQEIIVARQAEIFYGTSSIPLEVLRHASFTLDVVFQVGLNSNFPSIGGGARDNANDSYLSQLIACNEILKLLVLAQEWKRNNSLGMREALHFSRAKASTDPRDRVYAMLGLTDPVYNIKPNYQNSNTVADVFTGTTRAIIEHDESLDILLDSQGAGRNMKLALPSWVPDFSTSQRGLPFCIPHSDNGESNWDASLTCFKGHLILEKVPAPQFLIDEQKSPILRCAMISLGPVASKETLGASPTASVEVDDTLAAWQACMSAAGLEDVYAPTKEILISAFSRCLTFGASLEEETEGDSSRSGIVMKTQSHMRLVEASAGGAWRFFVTPHRVIGLAPSTTRHDDLLCILIGARMPLIIRKLKATTTAANSPRAFELVGVAYAHGYMEGQAVQEMIEDKREPEIELIDLY